MNKALSAFVSNTLHHYCPVFVVCVCKIKYINKSNNFGGKFMI